MYVDSFFADKWRVFLWAVIFAFLLLLILASIKTSPSAVIKPSLNDQASGLLDRELDVQVKGADFTSVVNNDNELSMEKRALANDQRVESKKAPLIDIRDTQFQPPVAETFISNDKTENQVVDQKEIRQEVLESIESWRSAWQGSDVQKYLESYSPAYQPEHDELYKDWRDRRKRIVGKKQIRQIALDRFRLALSEDGLAAGVQFEQSYQSGTYADKVLKRLYLKKINNEWKIAKEHSVEDLAE